MEKSTLSLRLRRKKVDNMSCLNSTATAATLTKKALQLMNGQLCVYNQSAVGSACLLFGHFEQWDCIIILVSVPLLTHELLLQCWPFFSMHKVLKLEKSAISKVQKNIICHFQKWQKINFCTRKKFKITKNAIFGLKKKTQDFW